VTARLGRTLRLALKLGRYSGGLVVLTLVLGYAALLALRLEPMTMLTGSMGKTIPPGSLVITRQVSPTVLRVGDVITFQKPLGESGRDTHRIVKIARSNGHTIYRTKGDANASADPWAIEFLPGQSAHRVVASVPQLGLVLLRAHGPWLAVPLIALLAWLLLSTFIKVLVGPRLDMAPAKMTRRVV
jgi:signal peptidase I